MQALSGAECARMSARSHVIGRLCRTSAAAASLLVGATACTATGDESSGREARPTAAVGSTAAPDSAAPRSAEASDPTGTQRVVLAVEGMACESCERTIAVMLRRTPGVRSAEVSVARGEAVVSYDSTRTTPAALVATIERLGYRVSIRGA